MLTVSVNGRIVPPDDARVPALDAGLQHGVGLFETMLGGTAGGRAWVFRLHEHLKRLAQSAKDLRLSDSLRTDRLAETVLETVSASGLERARVRLTVTGGPTALRGREGPHEPTVLVVAQPATVYPEEMFARGVSVVVADTRISPLQRDEGHKTLNYWWRLRELQAAAAKRAAEALVFQVTNHVCGGCVSNVLCVKDGALRTPWARGEEPADGSARLPAPVRPGVTRGVVFEVARRLGLACVPSMLSIRDVLDADEVFLTNSSWGVLPVVKVEAEAIGDAVVGEVTRRVRSAWLEEVRASR